MCDPDPEDPEGPEDPGNSEDCLPDDVTGAFYTAHKPACGSNQMTASSLIVASWLDFS